jgi:DNA invertase Pin-like site-specific DNA recombinase
MNGSTKIQPGHRERRAVVYLRQSSPKQVLHNRESAANQRALREVLLELGWARSQIQVIDEDQARSARHVCGRDGFQKLVADVSLRQVGIIVGYEVSRLSRNCADWHRLLELCALFDTLIADVDGIYHPRDFNDRILLGLKGTLSEAELHSLRLRLDAGRLSKAKRGELIQHLPTGLVRNPDGIVQLDPDRSIRERIGLVFTKFQEVGSVQKVLIDLARSGLKLPRRQRTGPYAGEVLWKDPSIAALHAILKNPAYAGAFAYGRRRAEPARQLPGRPNTGRLRRPRSEWLVLLKGVFPGYITWDRFEWIQNTIAQNAQQMKDKMTRSRAIRGGPALLSGLVRCTRCGHTMHVAYKDKRFQYVCSAAWTRYAKPTCQHLSGLPIDAAVVEEFFRVLQPAQIDALERVNSKQAEHHRQLIRHQEQEITRLEYAAARAERQYNHVDPENRLIASTLETRWENALSELTHARARLAETTARMPTPVAIPAELRAAFADIGRCLPDLWPQLSSEARKRLLRTLVVGVNMQRGDAGRTHLRIVWTGGVVTDKQIRMPMAAFRNTEQERLALVAIRRLADEGRNDAFIAEHLNREGLFPCKGNAFTAQIVQNLRLRKGIVLGLERVRRGELPPCYTVNELAKRFHIHAAWFYREIAANRIVIEKDPRFGCYLFPRTRETIQRLKQLRRAEIAQVSFPKGAL